MLVGISNFFVRILHDVRYCHGVAYSEYVCVNNLPSSVNVVTLGADTCVKPPLYPPTITSHTQCGPIMNDDREWESLLLKD